MQHQEDSRPSRAALPEAVSGLALRGVLAVSALTLLCSLGIALVPLFSMQVFNRVLTTRNVETLASLSLGLLIGLVAYAVLDWLRNAALPVLADRFAQRLSLPLLRASAGARSAPRSASGAEALRDLETLRQFIASPVCLAPFDLAWSPLLALVLMAMHWGYGLLALCCGAVLLGMNVLGDALSRRQLLAANEVAAVGLRDVSGAIQAAEAVVAMRMLPALARRWDREQRRAVLAAHAALLRARGIAAATRTLRLAMNGAMIALGVILVAGGHASAGSMIAANMVLSRALLPFEQVAGTRRQWVEARAAWRRVRALLEDKDDTRYAGALPAPDGHLAVEGLVHVPPGAERPVLRGVSFTLGPGEVMGVVGPSGAGKSTVLRLILGMDRPLAGGVFLGGHNTALWGREDFARHVGYVPQSAAMTGGTVAENIARLGTPDLAAAVRAARQAGVHDIIAGLPDGYATELSGFTLSVGQRQRLALARALYGAPRLLLLDEPSAFLDETGEADLLALLRSLRAEGVSAILVSHRPALIAAADTLLLLRDGVVDRYGPRAEVLGGLPAQSAPSRIGVRRALQAAP